MEEAVTCDVASLWFLECCHVLLERQDLFMPRIRHKETRQTRAGVSLST